MIKVTGLFVQAAAGGIVPLLMTQQRRQKKWQAMLATIKSGDRVTTSGGIKGTVLSLKDDAIVLRVPPDNIKIEIARSSVVSLTTEEERT
jgi:preprotein translocase subunit YajC